MTRQLRAWRFKAKQICAVEKALGDVERAVGPRLEWKPVIIPDVLRFALEVRCCRAYVPRCTLLGTQGFLTVFSAFLDLSHKLLGLGLTHCALGKRRRCALPP